MRIRIIFNLKNRGAAISFGHQHLISQIIKGILLQGSEEKFRNFSDFNFSTLKGKTKVNVKGLQFLSSKITLVFSSSNEDFIQYLIEQIFRYPILKIGELMLVPESVEKEEIPEFNDKTKFICISPLVLIKPEFNDLLGVRFVSPTSEEFSDSAYQATLLRMKQSGKYTEEDLKSFRKFQIEVDEDYLRKIKLNGKNFTWIYVFYDQDIRYEVRGYIFPFLLHASKDVQEFVFTNGLGAFTQKGFGMLDLANSNPLERGDHKNVIYKI